MAVDRVACFPSEYWTLAPFLIFLMEFICAISLDLYRENTITHKETEAREYVRHIHTPILFCFFSLIIEVGPGSCILEKDSTTDLYPSIL